MIINLSEHGVKILNAVMDLALKGHGLGAVSQVSGLIDYLNSQQNINDAGKSLYKAIDAHASHDNTKIAAKKTKAKAAKKGK